MLNKRILVLMFLLVFLPLVGCFPTPTPPNEAPIITSVPITTAIVGVAYTYDVNATDPDGDTLTYSLITRPTGMVINSANGLIMWTPVAAQVGNNPVTVKVSDKSLSIIQSFIIKVNTLPVVNQAPIIYSTPITTATVGVTYFYDVEATDPNGDTLTYSLTTYPSNMNINSATGVIIWIPTSAQIGNNLVVVKASDGALSDTQTFTIKVSKPPAPPPVNHAPIITSTPNLTTIVGVKYTYIVKATDPDGDSITYSFVSGPTGMTFDDVATISWTPVLGQVGTHDVTVKASDGKKDATQGFTITVSKMPELITIRWLEDAIRFNPDGSVYNQWHNDPIPALKPGALTQYPATLIQIGGEYHFADVNDFYNTILPDIEGSVVIDGAGILSGYTTYTYGLPTKNDFVGQVEIIIGGIVNWDGVVPPVLLDEIPDDYDGIMVGTYTQWKYVFGTEEDVLEKGYTEAVPAPEQGTGWWFTSRTEYIAHGGK